LNSLKINDLRKGFPHARVAVKTMEDTRYCEEISDAGIYSGREAMKGYALNKMCFSFNSAENREAYRRDEEAYCAEFHLTREQRLALKHRNVRQLLDAGANIYYLAKWAGIFGIGVQQIGAQLRGMTEDEFRQMLAFEGKS